MHGVGLQCFFITIVAIFGFYVTYKKLDQIEQKQDKLYEKFVEQVNQTKTKIDSQ